MIAIPHGVSIYICIEPADFRKGINGLGALCRGHLQKDPMNGAIFVFRNRRKTSLKILYYDGEGYWLMMRRLSRGRLTWWLTAKGVSSELKAKELQTLIMNGNPEGAEFTNDWKKVLN